MSIEGTLPCRLCGSRVEIDTMKFKGYKLLCRNCFSKRQQDNA